RARGSSPTTCAPRATGCAPRPTRSRAARPRSSSTSSPSACLACRTEASSMTLTLSSEARLVQDTALEFFRDKSPITALRRLRDTNDPDGFSRPLWREMAELGWTGFLVPEDHGGTAFGVLGLAQVMEAAGRTLAASALLSTALVGASLLTMAGSEDQKSEHLPPLVAGERLFALALEEGSRHQPYRIATTAERQGAGYKISGQKVFV